MSGLPVKRTTASDEGPSPKSARTSSAVQAEPTTSRSSWCSSCWSQPVGDACFTSSHRVLSVSAAQREATEALSDKYQRLADLKLDIETSKARLADVMEAGERLAVMFSVDGQDSDPGNQGASLEGGEVTLELTHIDVGLSSEERESVVAALEGAELTSEPIYEFDGDDASQVIMAAKIRLNTGDQGLRQSVLEKLPLCVEGLRLPRGTALLSGDSLIELTNDVIEVQEKHLKLRILGRMATDDVDMLRLWFDEEEDEMYIRKRGSRIEIEPITTEISEVEFVDY